MNEWQEFYSDTTADRSTLQDVVRCPLSWRLKQEHGGSVGKAAVVGTEWHDAMSATVAEYASITMDGFGGVTPSDIARILRGHMQHSRPDVQPDVLDVLWNPYKLAEWLHAIPPWHIMAYDGATGEKSAQLSTVIACDLGMTVTATCELDMLVATQWKELVRVYDYKTGWHIWAESEIEKSFQFQMQALVVFDNHEEVEEVEVTIWNTRTNSPTRPVAFNRKNIEQYRARVAEACDVWLRYRNAPLAEVPGWPSREGCAQCSMAAYCTIADGDIGDVNRRPETWLKIANAARKKAEAIEKLLDEYVFKNGDVVTPDGLAYGTNKPKSNRRPQCSIYEVR